MVTRQKATYSCNVDTNLRKINLKTKPSTLNLDTLAQPTELKTLCKAISSIEAIISPDWESRYFSYEKNWTEDCDFCEMRNGCGDHLLILFKGDGICINGYAHESELNGWAKNVTTEKQSILTRLFGTKQKNIAASKQNIPSGMFEDMPTEFNDFIFEDPVKSVGTTFCIWSTSKSPWKKGKVRLPEDDYKDGSEDLLELLDGNPSTYKNWADEYYVETFLEEGLNNFELDINIISKIYNDLYITKETVESIYPLEIDFEALKLDFDKIGVKYEL